MRASACLVVCDAHLDGFASSLELHLQSAIVAQDSDVIWKFVLHPSILDSLPHPFWHLKPAVGEVTAGPFVLQPALEATLLDVVVNLEVAYLPQATLRNNGGRTRHSIFDNP